MKKEVDLMMFDLDGTLADTGRDLADAVNHVRSYLDLAPLEEQAIYGHVGRGVEHLLRSSLPKTSEEKFAEIMVVFLNHYETHLLDTTVLYPHVKQTLDYFGGKKKAVVSNKLQRLTISVLRGLGIEACFDAILGGGIIAQKKPDPAPIRKVLKSLEIRPGMAVIVGDSDIDIEAGRGAGVHTCGVTYGMGNKEELVHAKPDVIVDDLRQLAQYFR